MPENGPTTSGGALQCQLKEPTQVDPQTFQKTETSSNVITPNGTRYCCNNFNGGPQAGQPSSIVDTNGSQITIIEGPLVFDLNGG